MHMFTRATINLQQPNQNEKKALKLLWKMFFNKKLSITIFSRIPFPHVLREMYLPAFYTLAELNMRMQIEQKFLEKTLTRDKKTS